MSNRTFAALFVATTIGIGWFWRVAQDFDVPFLVRAAGGVASVLALRWWLQRRLDRASTAMEGPRS